MCFKLETNTYSLMILGNFERRRIISVIDIKATERLEANASPSTPRK